MEPYEGDTGARRRDPESGAVNAAGAVGMGLAACVLIETGPGWIAEASGPFAAAGTAVAAQLCWLAETPRERLAARAVRAAMFGWLGIVGVAFVLRSLGG